MSKLSEYFGEGEFDGRWAYVHALSYNKYAAQAVTDGGHTEFRLGEFPTEGTGRDGLWGLCIGSAV